MLVDFIVLETLGFNIRTEMTGLNWKVHLLILLNNVSNRSKLLE